MKVEQLSHEASRSARAIADADARAASAHTTMMQALQEQKTAEDRAAAAEARVNDAVALRLRSMGADRAQWPEVARKGVEEAEHAAAAAAARAREAEGQLEAVQREVEENAAQQARWKVRGRFCGSGIHFGNASRGRSHKRLSRKPTSLCVPASRMYPWWTSCMSTGSDHHRPLRLCLHPRHMHEYVLERSMVRYMPRALRCTIG